MDPSKSGASRMLGVYIPAGTEIKPSRRQAPRAFSTAMFSCRRVSELSECDPERDRQVSDRTFCLAAGHSDRPRSRWK